MQPASFELPPGKGDAFYTAEFPADASLPVPFMMPLIVNLEAWFGQLGIASRLLLFSSLFCSSFVTLSWYTGRLSRARMIRYTLLLWPIVAILCGLTLQQQTPTTTSTASDSEDPLPPDADVGQPVIPNIIDPEAIDPQSVCPGYKASNVKTTSSGLTADLTLAGEACDVYGYDIQDLLLVVEYQAADRLHIEILPRYIGAENSSWFILPEELIHKPHIEEGYDHSTSPNDLNFTWANEPTFSFSVTRKSTGDVLFTTEGSQIVYEDQFIEFSSPLPENYNLYGLGEVIHGFRLGNNFTRTFYAADVADIIDANIYGNHPFYLETRYYKVNQDTGAMAYAPNATDTSAQYKSITHGLYQRNAHAQEVLLRESNITWRALGGMYDLYFYGGPTQDKVTKAYQASAVGLPAMQQYWTFGYHQCRWGYNNWTELQDVIDNFAKFKIPLETIWSDIDYMKAYRNFENDPDRFGYDEGADFLARLHENNQYYVPIIDSAIYAPNPNNASDAYPPFGRGMDDDAFLLNPDGSVYIGAVWPGYTAFPDWIGALFNGTGANRWWLSEISEYSSKIEFDGIWIDMSEASSFCVGSCGSHRLSLNPVRPPFQLPGEPGNEVLGYPEGFNLTNATEAAAASAAQSSQSAAAAATATATSTATPYLRSTPTPGVRNVNWPPYAINNYHGDLAVHAVSPNATHHGGILEYDVHNLYGHQILNATYHTLINIFPTKRPFIIGRSQFAGSGKWAGHWGGDNYSRWAFMYFSIPQALSFSLFGIPMFGVDTCGFADNADMELCSRWMQLSAFFPFYRNHNTLGAASQEPYIWEAVAEASKTAMRIRYSLLPYIYTTFYLSHSTGSTTMRALAWEFPDEPWLAAADRQFLLGDAIMVTPCLGQGATTVDGVFPGIGAGTVWYDWYNQTAITGVTAGQNVTIDAPLGHIPLYIRGGHVIPMQKPGLTTAAVRASPWNILVALDGNGKAEGRLYLDDGKSIKPDKVTWVNFTADGSYLRATPRGTFIDTNALGNVTIMGANGPISKVELNGEEVDAGGWTLESSGSVLKVKGLSSLTTGGAWADEWSLTWS
ncbi:glycoside hydrolase family 31 protein [Hypoxylon sp. FL1150]|nr:glycoside hydrolase family 31 protein [Hypoxylon sp. FL1150]